MTAMNNLRSSSAWKKVSDDYSHLLELNRDFLRGKLHCTPYSPGSLYKESVPLRAGLLRLHDLGLFTISSQPYNSHTGPKAEFQADIKSTDTEAIRDLCDLRQRPYVIFLIPSAYVAPKIYRKLLGALLKREDMTVAYWESHDLETKLGNFPDAIDVSIIRSASDCEGLKDAQWHHATRLNTKVGAQWLNFDDQGLSRKLAMAKPVEVWIAATSWTQDTMILDIVEAEAVKAGFTKHFKKKD